MQTLVLVLILCVVGLGVLMIVGGIFKRWMRARANHGELPRNKNDLERFTPIFVPRGLGFRPFNARWSNHQKAKWAAQTKPGRQEQEQRKADYIEGTAGIEMVDLSAG